MVSKSSFFLSLLNRWCSTAKVVELSTRPVVDFNHFHDAPYGLFHTALGNDYEYKNLPSLCLRPQNQLKRR